MAKDKALEEILRRLEDLGALRILGKKLLEVDIFSMLNKDNQVWYFDQEEHEFVQMNLEWLRKELIDIYQIICQMWDLISEGQ